MLYFCFNYEQLGELSRLFIWKGELQNCPLNMFMVLFCLVLFWGKKRVIFYCYSISWCPRLWNDYLSAWNMVRICVQSTGFRPQQNNTKQNLCAYLFGYTLSVLITLDEILHKFVYTPWCMILLRVLTDRGWHY